MNQIEYPLARVTGGGRGRGFRVEEYLPWTALPAFRQTTAWNSLSGLYGRLSEAYDRFYEVLGLLSPGMRRLLQESQNSYSHTYQTDPLADYPNAYAPTEPATDFAGIYDESPYNDAYHNGMILIIER